MDRDPIRSAARLNKRRAELGPGPHICVLCGYANPWGLVRVPRTLLENHHVAIEKHDSAVTVLLCRNCHSEVTENLRRAGVSTQSESNPAWRVAIMLDALSVFLEALVPALRRWAELLRNRQQLEIKHEK